MMDFCATSDALNVNWYIYGNVWHDAIGENTGGSARIVESQYNPNGPVYLYNNTFVGMIIGVNLANGGSWNSSNASTNNIYFQTGGSHGFGKGHDDYDLSDVANSETHGIGGVTSGLMNITQVMGTQRLPPSILRRRRTMQLFPTPSP